MDPLGLPSKLLRPWSLLGLGLAGAPWACRPAAPPPVAAPPAPAPAATETPPDDTAVALELRREARWRILEWDLALDLQWTQLPSGEVLLCPAGPPCDPADASHHADLDSLSAAIDEWGASHWAASDEPPLMAIRIGVPEVLGHLDDNAQIRDIDRMFWALTVLDLYFTDADEDPGWTLAGMSLPEADQEIAWLAARYGLERRGTVATRWVPPLGVDLELPEDDLAYGIFIRPGGSRYLCALDAPPGKYCCYVYCDELDGDDALAEGH